MRDSVILDPGRFNATTRTWNVPVLMTIGVRAKELYIDDSLVPISVNRNLIQVDSKYDIGDDTRALLTIEINQRDILIAFWLPIILAVLALLGNIAQPALHYAGVLYQPESVIRAKGWGYDVAKHRFEVSLRGENLRPPETERYRIYVAVREYDPTLDRRQDTYRYVAGPFPISADMDIGVFADPAFTAGVLAGSRVFQGVVIKARTEMNVAAPFRPADYPRDAVQILMSPREKKD